MSLLLLFGGVGGGVDPEPEPEAGIIATPISGLTVSISALGSSGVITASPITGSTLTAEPVS